jgi:stress response protein YsnF
MRRPLRDRPADSREPHEPLARPDERGAVLRSEEELVLSTQVAHERVRLLKRIVTETVTTEVRRQDLHIERLPASDDDTARSAQPSQRLSALGGRAPDSLTPLGNRLRPASSARSSSVPFAHQSFDVTLTKGQMGVANPVVPRERIRVRKDIVTTEQAVADTVRKEQVELQHEPASG